MAGLAQLIGDRAGAKLFDELQPYRFTVRKNPLNFYLRSLSSDHSRRSMRSALRSIAEMVAGERIELEHFPWHRLQPEHTLMIREALGRRYASRLSSANHRLSALRGILKACFIAGLMRSEAQKRAVALLKNFSWVPLPAGRWLEHGERAKMIAAATATAETKAVRDAAIIALLITTGIRRTEAVSITLADFNPATGDTRVRCKGSRVRFVYCTGRALDLVRAWLVRRGDEPGYLFLPVSRYGQIRRADKPLNAGAIFHVVESWRKRAGLAGVSPHDFRHTFVTRLFDDGLAADTVKDLAGHQRIDTTLIYDRNRTARLKKIATAMEDGF